MFNALFSYCSHVLFEMESDSEVVVIDSESSNDEPVVKIARYGEMEEVCWEKIIF